MTSTFLILHKIYKDSLIFLNVFLYVFYAVFIVIWNYFSTLIINIDSKKVNYLSGHNFSISDFINGYLKTCLPTFLEFVDFGFYLVTVKYMSMSVIIRADVLWINNSFRIDYKSVVIVDIPVKWALQHNSDWICHVERLMTILILGHNMRVFNGPLQLHVISRPAHGYHCRPVDRPVQVIQRINFWSFAVSEIIIWLINSIANDSNKKESNYDSNTCHNQRMTKLLPYIYILLWEQHFLF